ncbi:MAG: hypothetical protein KGL39_35880 [Patescibacteria group bacterium]|nr:hypothetical protein [Patescibacteria group bacterium]
MSMHKWNTIVAELAAYAGISTQRVGEMTFLEAGALYWEMRAVLNDVNRRG